MTRNVSVKISVSALSVVGVLMGAAREASADYVVALSSPNVVGANDVYTMTVVNNGANGSGTTIRAGDITISSYTVGKYIIPDESQDLGDGNGNFDGINDVNLTGNVNAGLTNSGYTNTVHSDSFGSAKGTFIRLPGAQLAVNFESDALSALTKDVTQSWSSDANGGVVSPIYSGLYGLEVVVDNLSGPVADSAPIKFVNIVVPHGTYFTVNGSVGTTVQGAPNFITNFTTASAGSPSVFPTINTSYQSRPVNSPGQIVNGSGGTPGSPQGTFTPLGASSNTLTATASANGYFSPGYVRNITSGTQVGWINVSGLNNSGTDLNVFLIRLLVNGVSNPADDAQIVADLNASEGGNEPFSLPEASLANLGGVAWDIEFTSPPAIITNGFGYFPNTYGLNYFGFNFAGYSDGAISDVTVTDIAALPEPASAGMLMIGGLGLLARRRKRGGPGEKT